MTSFSAVRQRIRQRVEALRCRYAIDLNRFESLGENCEFGFLLRSHQFVSGGLFRWAFTPLHSLIHILEADFEGVYALDQLRPRFGAMVQDTRYDILFHSQLTSEQEPDGSRRFTASPREQEEIHANEKSKVDYLVAKFRRRLAEERLILVLKAFAPPPPEQLRALQAVLRPALRRRGSCLLLVTPAQDGQRPGGVRWCGGQLLQGTVAFMAPGESADALDYANWNRVLMKAYWMGLSPVRYLFTRLALAVLCRCGFNSFHGWWDQPRSRG